MLARGLSVDPSYNTSIEYDRANGHDIWNEEKGIYRLWHFKRKFARSLITTSLLHIIPVPSSHMSNRMPCVGTVIGLSALLFATIVQSGPTIPNVPATCDPNGPFKQPLWTCDVCGNYEVGSAPWRCGPYNATVCIEPLRVFPRRVQGFCFD